jgi:CRP-like cAMP-binding protein
MFESNEFKKLTDLHTLRTFKKGSIIIYQGEVSKDVYAIDEGIVKAYSINNQGDERIISFYSNGEIFPAPWSLSASATAPYYYETISDTTLHVIPQVDFKRSAKKSTDFMTEVADYYVASMNDAMMRINGLEQAKANEKLVFTLLYLVQRHGKLLGGELYRINLSLTQQMIASMLGLTRETTANELLKLKREKVLSYRSQRYIVDRAKLLHSIGE